jgi:hypothetical protein
MEEEMGRRKKQARNKAGKRYKLLSRASVNTGPTLQSRAAHEATIALKEAVSAFEEARATPIENARLGANRSLWSIAHEVAQPATHINNFEFAQRVQDKLAAAERLHRQDGYRRMDGYHRILYLNMAPKYQLWLLFRGTRWAWVKHDMMGHKKHVSVVYESKALALFVLGDETRPSTICWKQHVGEDDNVEI